MFLRFNQSAGPEFFLLGFQVMHGSRIILFLIFLLIFMSSIAGNFLIIVVVSATRHLHSPMYFFLSHLSFCDIILSSTVVPNLLQVTLHNGGRLTVTGCITQLNFFAFSSATECLLLTVMSYDRYVAICKPLHYQTIMSLTFCLDLVVFSWMLGLVMSLVIIGLLSRLDYCYSGDIDHFFCDLDPLLQLSCSDTTLVQTVVYIIATPETVTETLFIISSYVCIFLAIHRISSTTGKQKVFSTCSSHLAVVCMYYGTIIGIYVFSAGEHSSSIIKTASLVYTAVTPTLNPIIYSLRNQDIKNTLKKIFKKI